MNAYRLLVAASLVGLSACSLAPQTVLLPPPVPQSWPVGDAYLRQSEAALPLVSYQSVFTDPRLQQLIEAALVNNRDLRVAAANLAEARARVRATRAAQFPSVGVSGSADLSRSGNNGTDLNLGVNGGISSYEVDLFGKLANATAAERQTALASEASSRTVRLGLVADIAAAWTAYAADSELLSIARQTAENARASVRLTGLRLKGGIAPRTDLAQAQQILASAELSIAEQTTALAQDRNLLRLLVGADFDPALLPDSLGTVVPSFTSLPAGLDSSVLLRRPDIVEAEYLLRAANANVGVARAQLFPSFSLTGLLGFASTTLANLFTGGAFNFTAGAGVSASIFDGGARRANVAISEAQRDATLAIYEKAIQTAFRETADALADQGTLAARLRAARDNLAAAETNARLVDLRYRNGIDSFLDSLVAQRSLFDAGRQLVAVQREDALNRITLYRVLGGDQASSVEGPTS